MLQILFSLVINSLVYKTKSSQDEVLNSKNTSII